MPGTRFAVTLTLGLLACTGLLPRTATAQQASPPRAPRVAWQIDKPNFYHHPPVRAGKIWLGGEYLTAHDLKTGAEVHRAPYKGSGEPPFITGFARPTWRHPISSGGLIFVRRSDGQLHAFTPDLSRELWQVKAPFSHYAVTVFGDICISASGQEVVAITGGKVHWRTDLESTVNMRPATDGKRVFVGTADGRVVALGLHTGEPVWETETGGEFGTTSPVVDHGVLVLADRGIRDRRKAACNAFDAETGEQLWSTQFGSTGFSRPSIVDGRVWAGFGVTVTSFDLQTGELDWDNRIKTGINPFGLPGVSGDSIVFGNLDGNLYVHDRKSHELRWRFEVDGDEDTQVGGWLMHDGLLIVGSTRGIFALAETAEAEPVEPGFVLRPDR